MNHGESANKIIPLFIGVVYAAVMAIARFLRDVETLSYPEYRARHLFTAKLRLIVFIGFWFLYVLAFKSELALVQSVTVTISVAFIFTIIAYYLIIVRGRVILAMAIEIVSDVVAITAVIYLTGGIFSDFFTLYIVYCLIAGAFYNFRLAMVSAAVSYTAYMALSVAQWEGWLQLLQLSIAEGHHHHEFGEHSRHWVHPFLLAIFLAMATYITKIAHQFSQRRERMLEEKNRELASLHQMSSTVQSASPLPEVADRILNGMLSGLDFNLCLLMLLDKRRNCLVCYPPRHNAMMRKAEKMLGFPLSELTMPLDKVTDTSTIKFHRDLYQLAEGADPFISHDTADDIQKALDIQVMVTLPLIVEGEVVGTCLGLTTAPFIEDHQLATLEVFANQAALIIQTTMLIEELKRKNDELVEANRVKSEFLATMSHELRTPLTAIIGFSELLLEGVMGELNGEQRDSLREVLNNGTSLLDLINNLLDFVKVESGKMGLNSQPFNLADLVERLRRNLWPLIQRKRQEFLVDVASSLPPVSADEKRIQQVMLNLFSNAIKFTPEEGKIRVQVLRAGAPNDLPEQIGRRVGTRGTKKTPWFVISVSDSGIGIAPENLETIFEMFKQVDSSVSRSYEGTGLGLALAKQLVELHGGVIWAESELGQGATFVCAIPDQPI